MMSSCTGTSTRCSHLLEGFGGTVQNSVITVSQPPAKASMYDIVCTVILVALILGYVGRMIFLCLREYRHRKERFAERDVLAAEQWFRTFFPTLTQSQPILAELLNELGKEIGIEWTRFRPEDTFSESFLFKKPRYGDHDELDGFFCAQGEWITKHNIDPNDVPEPEVDRLDEYVWKMHRLLEKYGQVPQSDR